MEAKSQILRALTALREQKPLVHNITNHVVMSSTANALLALGASPAMVHAPDEVEDFVRISNALVINIGTLSSEWVAAMKLAIAAARVASIPWVIDPVGMGATRFRSAVAADLVGRGPTVVRANASEILALAGETARTSKGVDSTEASPDAVSAAKALARRLGTVVAVSGAVDYVTDGERTIEVHAGHAMMPRVTGLGCTATALIAAFCAVEPDALWAAVAGLSVLGVAGQRAAETAPGPGSLQVGILDQLYALSSETIAMEVELR